MRLFNLAIIFALCLAMMVFSLENSDPVTIELLPDQKATLPLSVALLMAAGLGSVLAWLFFMWSRFLHQLSSRRDRKEVRERDKQIANLSEDLETFKAELEKARQPRLSADEAEKAEAKATSDASK
ncbi:MAG: LapA family protein [Cyanobacteria bacterium J06641_5]